MGTIATKMNIGYDLRGDKSSPKEFLDKKGEEYEVVKVIDDLTTDPSLDIKFVDGSKAYVGNPDQKSYSGFILAS